MSCNVETCRRSKVYDKQGLIDFMKKHRPTLAGKRRKQPDRTYEDLRQKHKAKIADWMFRAVCEYYQEHGEMPSEDAAAGITDKIYEKIVSTCIWVPYDEVLHKLLSEFPEFEARIKEGRTSDQSQPASQPKSSHPKPKQASGKRCPNCGRKMKQQFIGLRHCKCGVSWQRGEGFFERSPDMVFALERQKVGKKTKQRPVIRRDGG